MDFLIPDLNDIFDIILISIALYSLFILLKRSTAIEIIACILIIFTLHFLATIFNLKMILSVLRGIQNYWIILIFVIFQSEIKNVISQLSKRENALSIFKKPKKRSHSIILEVIQAFSENKVGAILVFEKSHNLDSYISSGELLDALLSSKLLFSIYNTSNLLHDGAVIIRKNRLYAAKVVLPLSTNEDYSRSFGTRHLAAIGITEVSDAFCIVVSEQTGFISVTKDKVITQDISIEELLQVLTDEAKS
jgi:diadenylate cyclase